MRASGFDSGSFVTNPNWQNYGDESTLSYLVQMLGLTHQNFLLAATGIALAVALIRGFSRASVLCASYGRRSRPIPSVRNSC